ncbi:molybdenum cofactor guanylyltransferase MobA [Anianabacter salinae]|uniref:molybdenum cofactor guanylyltransferase MobA n=1 Tax=Anianabacter salinae TaxID=2851023 RepID=UPI00225E62B2|nr:molybdenum cofactor guanylyltransferase MobA [Anianabacter salinae]MBV0912375.1 molybdenum cofactor guanylyltransferase [Anianabacter salinae]
MIPAVIIAGGAARRMGGGDKTLLPLAGRTILSHVLDRLAPQAAPLAINANGDPARFAGFGLPVLPDTVPDRPGPLAGVLAALEWAETLGAPLVLTVSGDSPVFPADLSTRLAQAGPAAFAVDDEGSHPIFALWNSASRAELQAWLGAGNRRVMGFADAARLAQVHFAGRAFLNINTPQDLADAETLLRG